MTGTRSYSSFSHRANFIYDQSHPKRGRWVKRITVGISILVILSALSFGSASDITDIEAQQNFYCEMVEIHKADKSFGWPDYKGIYDQQCSGE